MLHFSTFKIICLLLLLSLLLGGWKFLDLHLLIFLNSKQRNSYIILKHAGSVEKNKRTKSSEKGKIKVVFPWINPFPYVEVILVFSGRGGGEYNLFSQNKVSLYTKEVYLLKSIFQINKLICKKLEL